jgi:Protein of unknown function (DUF4232)
MGTSESVSLRQPLLRRRRAWCFALLMAVLLPIGGIAWLNFAGDAHASTPAPASITLIPQAHTSVATAAAARVPWCTSTQLTLTRGFSEGAAGTQYQNLVITNKGARCRLGGFPAIFLYDSRRNPIGSGAAPHPLPAPVIITLAHNRSAHTVLSYHLPGSFDPGVCSSARSATLRAHMPGIAAPLAMRLTGLHSCPGLRSRSLQPGTGTPRQ